ncbi:MAG: hypothetical protein MK008_10420 [Bdellovibrionales bacterium]|nr:hypothetical protein [Bdellovibrionales bacterium]
MKKALLFIIFFSFINLNAQSNNAPQDKDIDEAARMARLGQFIPEYISEDYQTSKKCEELPTCKAAYDKFVDELGKRRSDSSKDEEKEKREKAEQECKTAMEKFDTARTEMTESCTAGLDCEEQVRTCLECKDNPEYCAYYEDDEEKKMTNKEEQLVKLKDKFKICPLISTQSIEKAKENFDKLKENKNEKTTEVQEGMQELIQKRNADKTEIEEMENELVALQKKLTQAMEDRNTMMQEAELEVTQKIAEVDTKIEEQRIGLENAHLKFAEKKEEVIDQETELQIACYEQANARMQASRERSLGALQNNKTLLNDTNQFLTQARRKLSTNQNAMFNSYFTMCWSKDKKTALQRRSLKRKENFFKKQYEQAVSAVEKSIERMQDQRKLLVKSAGLAVQKAAMNADRKISDIQTQMMSLQRKINSKKQENQTTMASDAQKLMHNQEQLSNLSKEEDFAQKIYDIHAKHAGGETTEPGDISKALTNYRVALDKATAAVRACSDTNTSYGDCSSAESFLERFNSDLVPHNANCESSSSGNSATGSSGQSGIGED